MKSHLLVLLLTSSLSGCAVRSYAYGHHPQNDCGGGNCCTGACEQAPRPPLEPRPDEHVHNAGCGHVLNGGVWVATGAAIGPLGGSVGGALGGGIGSACAATPLCNGH